MKQTITLSLTAAAPAAASTMVVPDSAYSSIIGARIIATNDNATAPVQVQVVISRAAAPLGTGGPVAEDALSRGDPLIAVFGVNAGQTAIAADLDATDYLMDPNELFSGVYLPTLGARVVGLESGKVATVVVEVETKDVTMNSANNERLLGQVLRFQGV